MVNVLRQWFLSGILHEVRIRPNISGTQSGRWSARRSEDGMETVIPSAKTLFNRPKEDAKRILLAAGFRPVRKGELPEHGDRVINCNRLYAHNHNSASTFESGTIDKPTKNSPLYAVAYDRITYYHRYSKSWFERVMWIRKKEVIKKPTEHKMETDDARADYMVGNTVYTNTTKSAMDGVLRELSNAYTGKTFVCYKLVQVAIAHKPVEPKQVQWL